MLLPGLSFQSPETQLKSDFPLEGGLLLVTDHSDAPADFLLIRASLPILKRVLKKDESSSNIKTCVFVSLTRELDHWKGIWTKAGVNVQKCIDEGSLVLIDVFSKSSLLLQLEEPKQNRELLLRLFHEIEEKLTAATAHETLLMFDDVAHLEWIGYSAEEITKLLRAIRVSTRKMSSSLLVIYHTLGTEPPSSSVHRYLLETCVAHVECRPLTSGRSGSVSGEILVRQGSEAFIGEVELPARPVLHYRTNDIGALLFDKGSISPLN